MSFFDKLIYMNLKFRSLYYFSSYEISYLKLIFKEYLIYLKT